MRRAGRRTGAPVVLLHGFPDDVRAYDGVAPALAAAGWRVIVPYLRGYGPTRFLDPQTPRSGQQAALGRDLAGSARRARRRARAHSPAMIGAAAPPASSRHCGRSASPRWSRSAATTSRTSPDRASRPARSRAPAVVPMVFPHRAGPRRAARRTGGRCAGSYGSCGRRTGISTTRPTSGRRRPSTTPILSRW